MVHEFFCTKCHEHKAHEDNLTTGYALDQQGHKICFDCCATIDRATMVETGHSKALPLYLHDGQVTNWPGTLRFKVFGSRTSRHNIGGRRTDVWFEGPDGSVWHGFQVGSYDLRPMHRASWAMHERRRQHAREINHACI